MTYFVFDWLVVISVISIVVLLLLKKPLISLVRPLVRPRLEYCSSIWDTYHQEYKNKLESVQRRAARFVCIDFRSQSHVSDMLRDLNWKTLEDR